MKRLFKCLILPLVLSASLASGAEVSLNHTILEGAALNEQGCFAEAAQLLDPAVQGRDTDLSPTDVAVGWSVLAFAYHNLGEYPRAEAAYSQALQHLSRIPQAERQYTSTLDDLAMMKLEQGQFTTAKALSAKAYSSHQLDHDELGVIRSLTTESLINLRLGNLRATKRTLHDAFRASQGRVQDYSPEMANLYDVKSSLDSQLGKTEQALSDLDRSIDIWAHLFGFGYYQVATALTQRVVLDGKLGHFQEAKKDFDRARDLLRSNDKGTSNVRYYLQKAYAEDLRASGKNEEDAASSPLPR